MPPSDRTRSLAPLLEAAEAGDTWRVSTLLLGMAVAAGLVTLAEAEGLCLGAVDDPQTIAESLAPKLEEAGLVSRERLFEILGGESR